MNATIKASPVLFVECGVPGDTGVATREVPPGLSPAQVLDMVRSFPNSTAFAYGKKLELTVDGVKFHPQMQRTSQTYPHDEGKQVLPPPLPPLSLSYGVDAQVDRSRFLNIDYSGHHDGGVTAVHADPSVCALQPLDMASRVTQGGQDRFVMGFWLSTVPSTTVDGVKFTANPEVAKRYVIGDAVSYAEFMRTADNAEALAWNLKATPDSTFIKGATGRWQLLGPNDIHISFAELLTHVRDTPASQVFEL